MYRTRTKRRIFEPNKTHGQVDRVKFRRGDWREKIEPDQSEAWTRGGGAYICRARLTVGTIAGQLRASQYVTDFVADSRCLKREGILQVLRYSGSQAEGYGVILLDV